jgi:hypothetical protein
VTSVPALPSVRAATILLRLLALLCSGICISFAHADVAKEKVAIRKQYVAWQTAYLKNDALGLLKLLDLKFEIVTETGKRISRADYKNSLLTKKTAPETYRIVPGKTLINGLSAKVWSTEEANEDGRAHRHFYLDVWVKSRGRWLMRRSTTLKEG